MNVNEFYPIRMANERMTLISKQMFAVSMVAIVADGLVLHSSYVEKQKETVKITQPECVDFTARDDFFDLSRADACTDELENGRVALIDLRGPEAMVSADELATIVSIEMAKDSYGYLTPQVEAVDVSPDVVDEVEDYTCDPYENSTADNVAYRQAGQLREQGYDKALVVTPLGLCDETVLGYAESTRDIATVGWADDLREDELVRLTQHELSHLYGIGHSSVLRGGELNDLVLYQYMYDDPRFETSIDIASIVKDAQRDEYGDNSNSSYQYQGAHGAIMGTPTPENQMEDAFSDYQLQLLSASRHLPSSKNADIGPVSLEPGARQNGDPIVAKVGSVNIEGFEKYDRVIVTPLVNVYDRWDTAEISLGSNGGDSLLLGRIYLKNEGEEGQLIPLNQQYTFVGSEAAVRVAFDDGTITVDKITL